MIFNMHLLTDVSRFLIRRFYSYKTVFTVLFNRKKKLFQEMKKRLFKISLELSSKPGKWSLPIQEELVIIENKINTNLTQKNISLLMFLIKFH